MPMDLLLDTHIFLWAVDNQPQLSEEARSMITDSRNTVFVSAVTPWEISIKKAIGKLDTPWSDYFEVLRFYRFTPLHITSEHALMVENLPMYHKDPFDRILIAQAQIEKLTIVTHDQNIKRYDVDVFDA